VHLYLWIMATIDFRLEVMWPSSKAASSSDSCRGWCWWRWRWRQRWWMLVSKLVIISFALIENYTKGAHVSKQINNCNKKIIRLICTRARRIERTQRQKNEQLWADWWMLLLLIKSMRVIKDAFVLLMEAAPCYFLFYCAVFKCTYFTHLLTYLLTKLHLLWQNSVSIHNSLKIVEKNKLH